MSDLRKTDIFRTGTKKPQKEDCPAKNTPQSLKLFLTDDVMKVFSKYNIELGSKIEIKLENYLKTKEIEYKYAVKIVNTLLLLLAILKHTNLLAKSNENFRKFNIKSEMFSKEFETLVKLYDNIKKYRIDLDNFLAADRSDITQ
jgi:glutamine synthetase type III